MNKNQKPNWKIRLCNSFGGFGYFSCLIQWLWVVLVYFAFIQKITDYLNSHSQPAKEAVVSHAVVSSGVATFNPFMSLLSIAIVLSVFGLCIYVIIKAPSAFTKTSKEIVTKSANTVAPLVIMASHKKETKKMRLKITSQIILIIKALVILVPVVLTLLSRSLTKQQIDFNVSIVVITTLAISSTLLFTLQYLLARCFKIKISELF